MVALWVEPNPHYLPNPTKTRRLYSSEEKIPQTTKMPLLSKLKPFSQLLSSPPELLFQGRCVSGTAKGKAKIKAGQALKRSKVPKKTSSASSAGRGGAKDYAVQRINDLVDSCINAPTPLRHLTPKQKLIEAERKKLGLVSKARKREMDGKDSPKEDFYGIGTAGLDLITLGVVDGEKVPKYDLTVEDGRRLAKEYSRVLMRKHRARQAAESTLLRLKKEAIEALPEGRLREAALVPDLAPFPKERFMATLTPPIEGYVEKIKEAAAMSVGKEKLRFKDVVEFSVFFCGFGVGLKLCVQDHDEIIGANLISGPFSHCIGTFDAREDWMRVDFRLAAQSWGLHTLDFITSCVAAFSQ
ncbi:hypothetical protein ACLOJK_009458 [Asimina triloba]